MLAIISHLRLPFSLLLMPVFWFALSQQQVLHINLILSLFVIFHLLLYPASNAYNSYMDQDKGPIGGLENPPAATLQLFYVSVLLDLLALIWSYFISVPFFATVLVYILVSRAYSYRKIRLKQYPILSFLLVFVFQGAWIYFSIAIATKNYSPLEIFHYQYLAMLGASFLFGGAYPISQIYQHQQDKADNVNTLSMKLGIKNTLYFAAAMFGMGMLICGLYFYQHLQWDYFLLLPLFTLPTLIFFIYWLILLSKNLVHANFKNTMRMNCIAALCFNSFFIYLFCKMFENK